MSEDTPSLNIGGFSPEPEPEKAIMVMEVAQWVFDKSASEFEQSISEECERVAADFKDYFMAKYLQRKNGVTPNV